MGMGEERGFENEMVGKGMYEEVVAFFVGVIAAAVL